jgi:hypothetical protein
MITDFVRRLPAPLRVPLRMAGVHTGRHRGERAHGAVADQQFVMCTPCGAETVAVVHGGIARCSEGHEQAVAS